MQRTYGTLSAQVFGAPRATQQVLLGCWRGGILLAVAASLLWPSSTPRTQELEPRAYSAAPVSTNFLPVACLLAL